MMKLMIAIIETPICFFFCFSRNYDNSFVHSVFLDFVKIEQTQSTTFTFDNVYWSWVLTCNIEICMASFHFIITYYYCFQNVNFRRQNSIHDYYFSLLFVLIFLKVTESHSMCLLGFAFGISTISQAIREKNFCS